MNRSIAFKTDIRAGHALLYLLFFFLVSSSCRKKEVAAAPKCEGYFASTFNSYTVDEAHESLLFLKAKNDPDRFDTGRGLYVGGGAIRGAVYNWRQRVFYFMNPNYLSMAGPLPYKLTGPGNWGFLRFDFNSYEVRDMGDAVLYDSVRFFSPPASGRMICNSISDIVYCAINNKDSCKVFEISRGGVFGVRQICVMDTPGVKQNVVVDETSGYVFFIEHNILRKIDPATGSISAVKSYTDVNPISICYNSNDGMIYALDRMAGYRLLRIDPGTGAFSIQGAIDKVDQDAPSKFIFDHCSNQLILLQWPGNEEYANAYWISPENAKISKVLIHVWLGGFSAYIDGPYPGEK